MEGAFHAQFYRIELETSMTDLSRLHQLPEESVEVYIGRFRKAKYRCRVSLPENEFVKLAIEGMHCELRKRLTEWNSETFLN